MMNNKFWTDERIKDVIFESMIKLNIKRFPTCNELKKMPDIEFESEGCEPKMVKGAHIHQLITRSGGYSSLATEYKLDRLDAHGKLIKWKG